MGSDSDLPVMSQAADILAHFKIPFELDIVSAHRTPGEDGRVCKECCRVVE
jgi:phosphoribosylaminoimidazole carboxylase